MVPILHPSLFLHILRCDFAIPLWKVGLFPHPLDQPCDLLWQQNAVAVSVCQAQAWISKGVAYVIFVMDTPSPWEQVWDHLRDDKPCETE